MFSLSAKYIHHSSSILGKQLACNTNASLTVVNTPMQYCLKYEKIRNGSFPTSNHMQNRKPVISEENMTNVIASRMLFLKKSLKILKSEKHRTRNIQRITINLIYCKNYDSLSLTPIRNFRIRSNIG